MTDDRDRLEAELQEIAEDYVLHWLGETDSKAVRSLHQHLRHRQAEGLRMAMRMMSEFNAPLKIHNLADALDGEKGE